jgi:hypothetical protein
MHLFKIAYQTYERIAILFLINSIPTFKSIFTKSKRIELSILNELITRIVLMLFVI